jgi:hypothetical protein
MTMTCPRADTTMLPVIALLTAALAWAAPTQADTTPDPFNIGFRSWAHPGALVYSRAVEVTGIDEPTPIEIVSTDALDAGYSIGCTTAFTVLPGLIANGQSFCVRHRAGYYRSATAIRVGTFQGPQATFESYAFPQHQPSPAGFPIVMNAPIFGYAVAGPVLVVGVSNDVYNPPEVEVRSYRASYQVDCAGSFVTWPGRVADQHTLCAGVSAADIPDTLTMGTITVGDATWTIAAYTGAALPGTAAPFAFAPAKNIARGHRARGSTTLAIVGGPAPVSVSGGFFATPRQTETPVAGFALDGDSLMLSHDASLQFGASVTTAVTVGGVTATFTSTTVPRSALTSGKLQDLNGDGSVDMIWRNARTGDAWVWLIDPYLGDGWGGQEGFGLLFGRLDWMLTHSGDFNGDGTTDLVWRNAATGETALWLMVDGRMEQGAIVMADADWRVTHVADFDGDGRSDLLWHDAATGQTAIWLMDGLHYHAWAMVMQDRNWRVEQVGDLDGDGRFDLVWRSASSTAVWLMNGTAMRAGAIVQTNGSWRVELVGDIDGDGRDDLVWSGPDDQVALYLMDGIARRDGARLPPDTGRPVAIADFDGDGKSDLLVATPLGIYRYLMDGLAVRSATLDLTNAQRLLAVADYNGDGRADVMYRDAAAWVGSLLKYSAGPRPPLRPNPLLIVDNADWVLVRPAAEPCEKDPCLMPDYRPD